MRRRINWCLLVLAILLALPWLSYADKEPAAGAESDTSPAIKAENLSFSIKFDYSDHYDIGKKLLYDSLSKPETFSPYERFSIWWNPNVPGHWLCVQWNVVPEDVRILQYDRNDMLLAETCVEEKYDTVLELEADTGRVVFVGDRRGMEVARIALFSEGILPEPFYPWKETFGHLDYLVISTHPDDDVIFMGGIAPIYGMERGYTGTIAYVTNPGRLRLCEAVKGAWTMGVRYRPLFLGFRDVPSDRIRQSGNKFVPEAVTLAIVRMLRQERPLVVFTQDLNGEYGHWQHKVVSASVVEACKLAADESYDPASVAAYGAWEVKKCYLHLYQDNPLILDVNTPLASMEGKTVIEIDKEAFLKHNTQQNGRYWVQTDWDAYPLCKFGMAYGTVEAGEDAFDNIDPALLVSALLQTDTP